MNGYFTISDHGKVKPVYEQTFARRPSNADALESALWEQVSGKASASVQPSAQLQSEWARFQATRTQPSRREIELEAKLFEQVAATGSGRPKNGDSSPFAGKAGL